MRKKIEMAASRQKEIMAGKKENLLDKAKFAAAYAATAMYMMPAHASGGSGLSVDTITVNETDADTLLGQVIGIIMLVPRFIGAAMLIWGFIMFAMSIRNDEPESKQKALLTVFSGLILFFLKEILSAAGIIS